MEDHINTGMAVFKQICDINEIDPQVIQEEVQKQYAENLDEKSYAEKLIRAAFDHRAKALIGSIHLSESMAGTHGGEYTIDSDSAAPSFQINEDFIRSKYDKADAEKIIEVLGDVQLPVW